MTETGRPKADEVTVSDRQRAILERWVRNKADVPHRLVERSSIVLMSVEGISNAEQGRRLDVDRQRVRRWRRRWAAAEEALAAAEAKGVREGDLKHLMSNVLGDDERTGRPAEITAEQVASIIAVACEVPSECGRPVTHWNSRELTEEVLKRNIVDSITPRHVRRLLKRGTSDRT